MSTGFDRINRTYLGAVLVYVFLLAQGCCQNCCRQQQPACPPVTSSAPVVRYGSVCEAPAEGTVISQAPAKSSSIADAPRPKVVVSEPSGRVSGGWRRTDPESMATTRVEGGVDDDTRNR